MKKLIVLAILSTIPMSVLATDKGVQGVKIDFNNPTTIGIKIDDRSLNFQNQKQLQNQYNKQDVQNNINFDAERNPVNSAVIGALVPSAQCMGVANGAVQGMSIGVALGKSYESKPCNDRELARMFISLGHTASATEILCNMDGAEVVTSCNAIRQHRRDMDNWQTFNPNYNPLVQR